MMLVEMLRALAAARYKRETHYCMECPDHMPGLNPLLVKWYKVGDNYAALILKCPEHGRSVHSSHEHDCWCVK